MFKKLLAPESLARMRKRIKKSIKAEQTLNRTRLSFWQGEYGYQRDKEVYK